MIGPIREPGRSVRTVARRVARAVTLVTLACVVAAEPRWARAAGFELDGISPAGTAMVGALTAVPGDASAVAYNPAGLALQRGSGLLAGGVLSFGSSRVSTSRLRSASASM